MATMHTNTEKRLGTRNTIPQPVSVELIGISQGLGNDPFAAMCVDISSTGLGMTTHSALRKGDVLKLNFAVTDMQVTLPILTEVMWMQQVDNQYRAGLRFLA